MPYRAPHPFAPPRPGGSTLEELVDRHAHLVAVGLANCRAAQALHKEITRRKLERRNLELETKNPKLETKSALPNDDDHYNPLEARDKTGRWEAGGTNSSTNASVAAQVKGSPLKFGFGLNEGLQQVASSIAQGMAQLSDPGPLKDNFQTFLRAQEQALAMVPNPQFDPLTLEPALEDTFERAMSQMIEEREIARERLRAPWESFSEAAAEEANEFGQLKDSAPGAQILGTAGTKTGQLLGYTAPFAIPYVGQVTGPLAAGLASAGDTFNQAFAAYKQAGLSDEDAREKAREVAVNTGVVTGMIFAFPIGRLASLPKSALSQLLLAMGINGAQMSADQLQSLLQAKASYNPNLTLADIAKESGNSFLMGAMSSGLGHVVDRASQVTEPPISLQPYGGPGGGHHPVASAAVRDDPNYNRNRALAISNEELARLGVEHPVITGKQQILYRDFAKTNQELDWPDIERIETQALVLSGVKSETAANEAVKRVISALKAEGVKPRRIPWGD